MAGAQFCGGLPSRSSPSTKWKATRRADVGVLFSFRHRSGNDWRIISARRRRRFDGFWFVFMLLAPVTCDPSTLLPATAPVPGTVHASALRRRERSWPSTASSLRPLQFLRQSVHGVCPFLPLSKILSSSLFVLLCFHTTPVLGVSVFRQRSQCIQDCRSNESAAVEVTKLWDGCDHFINFGHGVFR